MTTPNELAGFFDFFQDLPDPRIDRRKLHPVPEILLLTLCGMICGCEGWEDLEEFGKAKLPLFRKYLPYEHGIPSDDTLRRFFRMLDPVAFEERFVSWVRSFQPKLAQVAIDGKTVRHSFDTASEKDPIHIVSAFATETRLVLAQTQVDPRSNEIKAIPSLLALLDLRGALVSIDAMGCQSDLAAEIHAKGGDYLLALKKNQPTLHKEVALLFQDPALHPQQETEVDKGHGRLEERTCQVTDQVEWLRQYDPFPGLRSVLCIKSRRELNGTVETEQRYYVSSLPPDPTWMLKAVRSHWAIENSLHYVLDVSFSEDQARIRLGHAPRNIALVRKIVLNMLRSAQKPRQSLKRMRKAAGWDDSLLHSILQAHF